MTPNDCLAESILGCRMLTARYLAGFTDQNHTTQAVNLPNHVAWNLGHCALTMHRVAEKLDGAPPPGTDFGAGAGAYHAESVAFGSTPAGDPARYPGLARCTEIFNAACDRLAAAVRGASEQQLAQSVKWGNAEFPLWSIVLRLCFHNGFHTGQIAGLRRALGFKSIFA